MLEGLEGNVNVMEGGMMGQKQERNARWNALLWRWANASASGEEGITLIECLIAIAVVGITSAIILPPLFVAAGTRVQNHRAEQAMQLAQEEINRLQTMSMNEVHQNDRIPATATGNNVYFTMTGAGNPVQDVDPPGGPWAGELRSPNTTCNTYTPFDPNNPNAAVDVVPLNNALAIDLDGDCGSDFYMQVFRDFGTYSDREEATRTQPQRRPTIYRAVVRVYSRAILTDVGDNFSAFRPLTDPVLPASLQFTSGQGNQRERPLAVMTSLISWSSAPFANCGMRYHVAQESGTSLPTQQRTNCRGDVAQIP